MPYCRTTPWKNVILLGNHSPAYLGSEQWPIQNVKSSGRDILHSGQGGGIFYEGWQFRGWLVWLLGGMVGRQHPWLIPDTRPSPHDLSGDQAWPLVTCPRHWAETKHACWMAGQTRTTQQRQSPRGLPNKLSLTTLPKWNWPASQILMNWMLSLHS